MQKFLLLTCRELDNSLLCDFANEALYRGTLYRYLGHLLNKMLHWYLYLQAGRPVELGILDSNLEKLLEKELFVLYKQTYPTADYESMWQAYDAVVELWHKTGNAVAKLCGYDYPNKVAKDMSGFIQRLKLQRKGNM